MIKVTLCIICIALFSSIGCECKVDLYVFLHNSKYIESTLFFKQKVYKTYIRIEKQLFDPDET